MTRTFRSDNNAGLCPEARDAFVRAAEDHALGYGDDDTTAAAEAEFKRIFGDDIAVFFVATGTAANVLAIASLTRPWDHVVCHSHSHYNDDESTAPERFTSCRAIPVNDPGTSKVTLESFGHVIAQGRGDVHQPQPGVVTISNATEFGEVYSVDEVRAICDLAHAHGYAVHCDGARFANAVASLDVPPAAVTREAGLDVLVFGGAKNGLAYGEAVVIFPQGDGQRFRQAVEAFPYHRKSTGHLLSKHRFVSGPFAATLKDDIWLTYARHANQMARRLGDGLGRLGYDLAYPVEANGVFVHLSEAEHDRLQAMGHGYYPFGDAADRIFRFMCSFDTEVSDVDAFLHDAASAKDAS